jgi:hypothetical protein
MRRLIAFTLLAIAATAAWGADGRKFSVAPNWKAAEAWSGISAAEKMRMLQGLVREETAKVIPRLLAAAK